MTPAATLGSRYNGAVPRMVDYASRFAFLREAAFEVVLGKGVDALSRQSVADVQGVSASTVRRLIASDADLLVLAAEEVTTRRRHGRWRPPGATPHDHAVSLIRTLVPCTDQRIAEELVWLRIVLSTHVGFGSDRVPLPADGSLRQRYQVAMRGYADPEPETAPAVGRSAGLAAMVADRQAEVASTIDRVVCLLEVPGERRELLVADLHLLVEGLTLAVCSGRLSPDEGVQTIERTVERNSRPNQSRPA